MNKNTKIGLVLLGIGIVGRVYTNNENEGTLTEQSTSIKGASNLLMLIGGSLTVYQIIKNK